jgi:NarL family two-component system response regulator LiaR
LEMLYTALQDGAVLSAKHTGKVIAEFAKSPTAKPKVEDLVNLTNREKDVLILISQKQSDKQIAQNLSVSLHTVKSHVRNILAKLKVGNRRQAAEYAIENKIFPIPTEN